MGARSYPSIHILGSRQYGGADQFYVRLIRALQQEGQEVIPINRAGSPVAKALTENGPAQVHLPLANQWDFWSSWQIRRIVGRYQPCIVQTYMGRATRLTRLDPKSEAVHVARLGGFYKIEGYYRHAHAWVGNTRAVCDYMVSNGLPSDRVFQIGNFVPNPVRISPQYRRELREQYGISEITVALFALGRLIEKKGFSDLLQAFAKLEPEYRGRPLLLMIAGKGGDERKLKSLCSKLGLDDRVRWLGWQNPEELYLVADLFVCPSRHEPLGNVILEAWSYGLPVISTRTDGARELIDDDQSGLLCAVSDPKDLADRMRDAIAASEATRKGLVQAGYQRIEQRHSRAAVVKAYLDLYQYLLSTRSL